MDMIHAYDKAGMDLWISMTPDCCENAGGWYCQTYSDANGDNPVDDFCIHTSDCDCDDLEAVEKFAREHYRDEVVIIPGPYRKFPEDVIRHAFDVYPADIQEVCDPETYTYLWDEDANDVQRHCFVFGIMDERKRHATWHSLETKPAEPGIYAVAKFQDGKMVAFCADWCYYEGYFGPNNAQYWGPLDMTHWMSQADYLATLEALPTE